MPAAGPCGGPRSGARPRCGRDVGRPTAGGIVRSTSRRTRGALPFHREARVAHRRRQPLPDAARSPRARPRRSVTGWRAAHGTSIGVPSGASRRSRRRDVVRDADAAVRHRLPEQPRQVGAVDADDVVVGQSVSLSRRSSRARTTREGIGRARTRTGRRSRGRAGSSVPRGDHGHGRSRGAALPSRTRLTSSVRARGRTTILFATGWTSAASAGTQPRRAVRSAGKAQAVPEAPSTRPRRDASARTIGNWRVGPEAGHPRARSAHQEGAGAERTATACVSSPAAGNAGPGRGRAAGCRAQQTRTPSRARSLRRMRRGRRPPPHDKGATGLARTPSRGPARLRGEGAGGAAPSPPRTGGRPLFRSTRVDPRSASNLRARARIPRSRHRSSLDDRPASWPLPRRILPRRVLGRRRSGGLAESDPRRGARVSARVRLVRRGGAISRPRQRRGRSRSPRTLSQCASGRPPWPGNGASRRPGSRSRARERLAASWCPSRRH